MATASNDLNDLRLRFRAEEPRFAQLRDAAVRQLLDELPRRKLVAVEVDGRVKDVASFIKKSIRKQYADPWAEIRDKVGVRITCVYADSIPDLEAMVRDLFNVSHFEDKRSALEPNRLDYLGSHFEVSLRLPNDLSDLVFEVQVHSVAEGLWAAISHELLYKAAEQPPGNVSRSLYRLMALVELFDLEVDRAREAIMAQPRFPEAVVLQELERHFYALTAHRADPQLSRMVVGALRSLWTGDQLAAYPAALDSFVALHAEKLTTIYANYLSDDRNPLMSQPESLLVFERLENDFQRLPAAWSEALPLSLLESFGEIWGRPLEVED